MNHGMNLDKHIKDMKTRYQSPEVRIFMMHTTDSYLLSTSETTVEGGNGGWVKEDVSSRSGNSYNVWNDDWSKE